MTREFIEESAPLRLDLFEPCHAEIVASWAATGEQLRVLAPGTSPPLTAQKVRDWQRTDGMAYVLAGGRGTAPIGYGELNRLSEGAGHLWIGHVIVEPRRRRKGLGRLLVQLLLREGFNRWGAERISLIVFPDNMPAVRCYQWAGFLRVAEEYHYFPHQGGRHKMWRMQVERTDLGYGASSARGSTSMAAKTPSSNPLRMADMPS